MERLQKKIASLGYCSRRKAEELITKGLVEVNGEIVTKLGTTVKSGDVIVVEGNILDTNKNYIEGFKIYKYNISGTTVTPNGYIYLSRENGFREYAAGGNNLIFGNNGNEQFASITNQTTQQVITNQLPKEAKGDTHFGIQIVPMTVNNTGDGKTHTGIAFLKY